MVSKQRDIIMKKLLFIVTAFICTPVVAEAKVKSIQLSAINNMSDSPISVYEKSTKQTIMVDPKSTKEVTFNLRKQIEVTHNGNTKVIFNGGKHIKTKDGEVKTSSKGRNFLHGFLGGSASTTDRYGRTTGGRMAVGGLVGGGLGMLLGHTKNNINVRRIHGISSVSALRDTSRTLQLDPAGVISLV